MAIQQTALVQRFASHSYLSSVLIVAVVVALMLIATAIFGVQRVGPSFDIVADPGAPLLPF